MSEIKRRCYTGETGLCAFVVGIILTAASCILTRHTLWASGYWAGFASVYLTGAAIDAYRGAPKPCWTRSCMTDARILQDGPDEHVFIVIECPERPKLSLDLMNCHGRRCLEVRVDGMGIFGGLVDLKELSPKGESMFRYCGMCGEKLELLSSRSHQCKESHD